MRRWQVLAGAAPVGAPRRGPLPEIPVPVTAGGVIGDAGRPLKLGTALPHLDAGGQLVARIEASTEHPGDAAGSHSSLTPRSPAQVVDAQVAGRCVIGPSTRSGPPGPTARDDTRTGPPSPRPIPPAQHDLLDRPLVQRLPLHDRHVRARTRPPYPRHRTGARRRLGLHYPGHPTSPDVTKYDDLLLAHRWLSGGR